MKCFEYFRGCTADQNQLPQAWDWQWSKRLSSNTKEESGLIRKLGKAPLFSSGCLHIRLPKSIHFFPVSLLRCCGLPFIHQTAILGMPAFEQSVEVCISAFEPAENSFAPV